MDPKTAAVTLANRSAELLRRATTLFVVVAICTTALADGDVTARQKAASGEITFHHVYASGTRDDGDNPKIPNSLEEFADELKNTKYASFRRVGGGKSKFATTPKTTTKLPNDLGTLTFEKKSDGIRWTLTRPEKKPLAAKLPSKKKLYLEFDKLKNDKGEQYILLVRRD